MISYFQHLFPQTRFVVSMRGTFGSDLTSTRHISVELGRSERRKKTLPFYGPPGLLEAVNHLFHLLVHHDFIVAATTYWLIWLILLGCHWQMSSLQKFCEKMPTQCRTHRFCLIPSVQRLQTQYLHDFVHGLRPCSGRSHVQEFERINHQGAKEPWRKLEAGHAHGRDTRTWTNGQIEGFRSLKSAGIFGLIISNKNNEKSDYHHANDFSIQMTWLSHHGKNFLPN